VQTPAPPPLPEDDTLALEEAQLDAQIGLALRLEPEV